MCANKCLNIIHKIIIHKIIIHKIIIHKIIIHKMNIILSSITILLMNNSLISSVI
jgi:hypothetical protein